MRTVPGQHEKLFFSVGSTFSSVHTARRLQCTVADLCRQALCGPICTARSCAHFPLHPGTRPHALRTEGRHGRLTNNCNNPTAESSDRLLSAWCCAHGALIPTGQPRGVLDCTFQRTIIQPGHSGRGLVLDLQCTIVHRSGALVAPRCGLALSRRSTHPALQCSGVQQHGVQQQAFCT